MSGPEQLVPRIIYSLWLQGRQQAPPLVQMVFRCWAELNPDYELRVLDAHDVDALLTGFAVRPSQMTPQALSDVVRARLLLQGGVWADATVFPACPLDVWLPQQVRDIGFFAFDRPGADRPLSSWFLAASPNNLLVTRWWAEVERFWSKPRTLATYGKEAIPADPVFEVAPEGGAATDRFPYFWYHYLFRRLVTTDAAFASEWAGCRKLPAGPPHALQMLCRTGRATPESIARAIHGAPVHKLDWRASYPLDLLAELAGLGASAAARQGRNLALGKPATQSSTSPWSSNPNWEIDASVANNGDTGGKVFHTQRETDPWWQVDLLDVFDVHKVVIYNRPDFAERLTHFSILGSQDAAAWSPLYRKTDDRVFGADGQPFVADIEGGCRARFVRIRLDGYNCLHFRECQVYGVATSAGALSVSAHEDRYDPALAATIRSGRYDLAKRTLVGRLLQSGDRVLEAGTGIGTVSMAAALVVGAQNVLTFDGNPEIVADAKANFQRNGLYEIEACVGVLKSASDTPHAPAECDFHIDRSFPASRPDATSSDPGIVRTVRVPLFCLEDEIASHGATVLICDIGASEGGRLLASADLSGIRLVILAAMDGAIGSDADAVAARLASAGFRRLPVEPGSDLSAFQR